MQPVKQIMNFFGFLLLGLIHWIYDLVLDARYHIKLWRKRWSQDSLEGLTASYITHRCANLHKRPKHLAIGLNERGPISYSDLANLICWCLAIGIRQISLYDPLDRLKSNQGKLLQQIRLNHHRLFPHEPLQAGQIHWKGNHIQDLKETNSLKVSKNDNGVNGNGKNGHVSSEDTHISLLSPIDGKIDIVKAARHLAQEVRNRTVKPSEIDEAKVSENLASNRDMPDPDMLILCGRVWSTLGFLPWQIRLTEIHRIDTHRSITFEDYFKVLQSFSKCQQRFGK